MAIATDLKMPIADLPVAESLKRDRAGRIALKIFQPAIYMQ